MRLRTVGYAFAAGVAAFLVVFAAVAELLVPSVEFSVLLGLPAGLVAGGIVAAAVLVAAGQEADPTRRALATGLGASPVALLVSFVAAVWGLGWPVTSSLVGGAAVGVLAGLGTGAWHRRTARWSA